MFSFLPEWVPAHVEVDGKFDVFLARWEDADPVIRMIVILSFVLSLLPKTISVKIQWVVFPFAFVVTCFRLRIMFHVLKIAAI